MAQPIPQSQVDSAKQFETTRLAAAAYQAKAVVAALASGQTGSALQQATQTALTSGEPSFTPVQARDFLKG